jgi:hypothetical protein
MPWLHGRMASCHGRANAWPGANRVPQHALLQASVKALEQHVADISNYIKRESSTIPKAGGCGACREGGAVAGGG